MNEQTSACKSRYCTPQGGGKRRRGERFDVLEVKKKGQKKRGQVKKRLKIKEMEMRKVSNRQTGRQGGVGGGFVSRVFLDNVTWHTLLILAQRRDPASPSAQGQGRSKGSASHPPPPQPPPHVHRHGIHPPFSRSPGRHPTRPAYISIKQSHGNLLRVGWAGPASGTEQRLASLNNSVSDEKALGELDIHYKRDTPR